MPTIQQLVRKGREVLQVLAPSKKREGRLQVFSCRFTFLSL